MTAKTVSPQVRRYVMDGEGVVAIARALGTRPSYVLRLLLLHGVYERHQPWHSEWARAHAPGKDAEDVPEQTCMAGECPPTPMRAAPAPPTVTPSGPTSAV